MPTEVEIKFHVHDPEALKRALRAAGFRVITPRTHEFNQLFDFPRMKLRGDGKLLRLRHYGKKVKLTFKAKKSGGKHKSRTEIEVDVGDAEGMAAILSGLGLHPSWAYEKFRTEFSDNVGHVVLDETPIGVMAEIEGCPEWIDATAKMLGITEKEYLTASYAELFRVWQRRTRSKAVNMLWKEIER